MQSMPVMVGTAEVLVSVAGIAPEVLVMDAAPCWSRQLFPFSTTGEYGALPLSQCAGFYTSGNILATTCSPLLLTFRVA